jgi:hypothetical protein
MPAGSDDLIGLAHNLRALEPIVEQEMNAVVLSCTRIRRGSSRHRAQRRVSCCGSWPTTLCPRPHARRPRFPFSVTRGTPSKPRRSRHGWRRWSGPPVYQSDAMMTNRFLRRLHRRLERLEKGPVTEPATLLMPDGRTEVLRGDCIFEMLSRACSGDRSPETELLAQSISSTEPGGGRLLHLARALLNGPGQDAEPPARF